MKMKKLLVLIICAVGIVFLTEAEEAQPKTLHVGPDPGGFIQPLGDIHVYPFSTIQAAIDYAEPNDTIIVHEGTYDENGLKINKSVDIVGDGTVTITGTNGAFDSDLKFHGTGAPGTKILGSMDYVVGVYNGATVSFTNIIIDGANNLLQSGSGQYFAGVAFYNADGSFSGCEIKQTASNPAYCGGAAVSIYVDTDAGSYELEVTNCTFNTWPKNAISAYGSGSTLSHVLTVDVNDSTFTGNDGSGPSDGFQNGIVGLAGLDIEVHNCTFSAIRPAITAGIYWAAPVLAGYAYKADSTRYAPARNLTVSGGCTFSNSGDVYVRRSGGVWITTTGTAVVENCTFTNLKGIVVDGSNSCDGDPNDFNPSSQDVTIKDCEFNGPSYPNSVDYYMCGVNIQRGAQVDIENCTFDGFHDDDNSDGEGVSFCSAHFDVPTYYTGSTGGSVTGCCTFSDCVIAVYSGTDVTPLAINSNNFDGTNDYGVWNNDADDTIDATNNWWGDASGPYNAATNPYASGDEVSDYVDYDPWWADETGSETGTNPVKNVTKGTSYDTIQAGVDAAHAGDTIEVSAGTYDEQIFIDKGLTLIGAGAGTTTISAPPSMDTVLVRGGSQAIQGVVNVIGATAHGITVDVNGFTVDGDYVEPASSSTWFAGIVYSDADGTIENNIISKVRQETLWEGSASWRGHGIWLGDASTVTIKSNTISQWQRNGVEIRDAAATATITDNTFTGYETAYTVVNAVTFYGATDGTVSGNIITDCRYTGAGYGNEFYGGTQACGIMSYEGSGSFTVTDNTIQDCDMGIYSRLTSAGVITGNTLENNLYFGIVFRKGDVTAIGNTITGSEVGILIPSSRPESSSAPKATCNNISGNTDYGLRNDASYWTDATYNWWGDASGPGGAGGGSGDAVSDEWDVHYCPWLLAPIFSSDGPLPLGDLNGDGCVDLRDFAIFALHWLEGCE